MRSVFVAGTDTEIATTRVSTALVRALRAKGQRVAVMKPVAGAAVPTAEGPRSREVAALLDAAGLTLAYADVNPYCLPSPVAPRLAAGLAGVEIDFQVIVAALRRLAGVADRVLVEGLGGWAVPLGPDRAQGDLVRALDLPVLLVVALRPGCLNHALLTARQILGEGMRLIGWVADALDPAMDHPREHVDALEHWLPVPRIATLGHEETVLGIERVF